MPALMSITVEEVAPVVLQPMYTAVLVKSLLCTALSIVPMVIIIGQVVAVAVQPQEETVASEEAVVALTIMRSAVRVAATLSMLVKAAVVQAEVYQEVLLVRIPAVVEVDHPKDVVL
jgi:hypothetical protein